LRDHAKPGDAVLLKGSRKYKMEEIIEDLLA
jgi:UDP-N-acetylmuramyl pentapeptide synthase